MHASLHGLVNNPEFTLHNFSGETCNSRQQMFRHALERQVDRLNSSLLRQSYKMSRDLPDQDGLNGDIEDEISVFKNADK